MQAARREAAARSGRRAHYWFSWFGDEVGQASCNVGLLNGLLCGGSKLLCEEAMDEAQPCTE